MYQNKVIFNNNEYHIIVKDLVSLTEEDSSSNICLFSISTENENHLYMEETT